MSYSVDNIIPYSLSISPAGLGYANFASATVFAPESELPVGFTTDTYRDYSSTSGLSTDFASTTETYKAAAKWLGGIPTQRSVRVYAVDSTDATWADTLDKARDKFWWFWTIVTSTVYADVSGDVLEIASWCNTNQSMFPNCQTDTSATAIRDPSVTTDVASVLNGMGYRFVYTFAHSTDAYAGIALAKWYAAVNYSAVASTITGEYKVLDGVATEDLTETAYSAMKAKGCVFCTTIDLQGSTVTSRAVNTVTHSSYGEFIDDVVNLSAFLNTMQTDISNVVMSQPKKLGQEPVGQAVLIGATKTVCQQYVSNNYLGPRNYTDPDDGVEKYVPGYQILTTPEEILDLSDADRAARKSVPISMRIFRQGAIHIVELDISVY